MNHEAPNANTDEASERNGNDKEADMRQEDYVDRWERACTLARARVEQEEESRQRRTEAEWAQIRRTYKERARMAVLKYKHRQGLCTDDQLTELSQLTEKYAL